MFFSVFLKKRKEIIEEKKNEVHYACEKESLSSKFILDVATTFFLLQIAVHLITIEYFLMKSYEI